MSENPIKPGVVIHLDTLTRFCGYFTTIHDVNNGYCCAHPKQEERQDGHGCCYSFSCPIAYELKGDDEGDRAVLEREGLDEDSEDWMEVHGKPRKVHVLESARRAVWTRQAKKVGATP